MGTRYRLFKGNFFSTEQCMHWLGEKKYVDFKLNKSDIKTSAQTFFPQCFPHALHKCVNKLNPFDVVTNKYQLLTSSVFITGYFINLDILMTSQEESTLHVRRQLLVCFFRKGETYLLNHD